MATTSAPAAVVPWQPSWTQVPAGAVCLVPMLWIASTSVAWHTRQSVVGVVPSAWHATQFGGVMVTPGAAVACSDATFTPASVPWHALFTQNPAGAVCCTFWSEWRGVMSIVWQLVQSVVSCP
jgi:hypothetical protein